MAWDPQLSHHSQVGPPVGRELVPGVLDEQPAMCRSCEEAVAHFQDRCAEAIRDARRKPDDQIWLFLFGALKYMLETRAKCTLCPATSERAEESNTASSSLPASRLGHFRGR